MSRIYCISRLLVGTCWCLITAAMVNMPKWLIEGEDDVTTGSLDHGLVEDCWA